MASYSSCMAAACLVAVLINGAMARQFTVGGSAGWVPPASATMSYNDWAGKNRFLIGDTLVFKYNPSEDAVVRVSAEDYNSCSTSNPISSFKDGNTVFQFPAHGPFYFISGNSSNCNNGEKLIVLVLAPRNNTAHFSHSPSPAPSTTAAATPSPAPTTAATTPSPAPTSTAATPSPAPTTNVATPSPAPTTVATPSPAPTTTTASPSPAPTTVVSPAPAPTTVVAPSPAPTTIATPVTSPMVAPSMSPANSEPLNTSPSPSPMVNPGGATPSASATGPAVSYLVYAAVTLVTVVLSGTPTLCN
ncbi:hypothetical protein SUGI_0621310 [Cryptomeria japonica]|uniref:early nodulin-like protein 9 n=1 Tax=Cryptomeria japonica TaxID=3369 RepID=UPI002414BB1B|nr:early nodulin-like protein 9 [Cryptomeria japonica]GLJ31048.1 hypothetical protein SUGI_0621310 [Cryptomeria japonica]